MTRLSVDLGSRSYDILIENGALDCASVYLRPFARDNRLIVITDENVWAAQGERLQHGLADIKTVPLAFPPGEATKNWQALSGLVDHLAKLGVERDDTIIAFGGGVIGDLAGFTAAIFKRGCNFVQVPTSLLAQVDSSVGGKTGINIAAGKNMVGAFHQPSFVLVDPSCLKTLPEREVRAGYAEIVKAALIRNAGFFDWLEAHGSAVLAGEVDARTHAIANSIQEKAAIVAEDERETTGKRALLNLGHTFAHALEAETGFSDRLLHGEAVAIGVALAFNLSVERGLCPAEKAERVRSHLKSMGLPTSLREAGVPKGQRLIAYMLRDKKKESGRLRFILARGIGNAFIADDIEIADVEQFLEKQN